MQIPKEQILDLLRQQGKDDTVGEADSQLPDQVDPEQHAGLLQKLGIDPAELLTTLLHELERSDKEVGLVTMCCGGGLGTGTLVQRV